MVFCTANLKTAPTAVPWLWEWCDGTMRWMQWRIGDCSCLLCFFWWRFDFEDKKWTRQATPTKCNTSWPHANGCRHRKRLVLAMRSIVLARLVDGHSRASSNTQWLKHPSALHVEIDFHPAKSISIFDRLFRCKCTDHGECLSHSWAVHIWLKLSAYISILEIPIGHKKIVMCERVENISRMNTNKIEYFEVTDFVIFWFEFHDTAFRRFVASLSIQFYCNFPTHFV